MFGKSLTRRLVVYLLILFGALLYVRHVSTPPAPLTLQIVDAEQVVLDGRPLGLPDLREQLTQILHDEPRTLVEVHVSAQAPSADLLPWMALLETLGVNDVRVLAEPVPIAP